MMKYLRSLGVMTRLLILTTIFSLGINPGVVMANGPAYAGAAATPLWSDLVMVMAAIVTNVGRSLANRRISALGTEPLNIGWGLNTIPTTAAVTDVNLFSPPITGSPEARTAAAVTRITTAANVFGDTYVLTGTITATGARTIAEVGVFDTSTLSPTCTVTGSLTNVATGSQLTSTQVGTFPATGNFYVQLDSEVALATWVDTTHINLVTRGINGTTNVTHLAAAALTCGGDGGASADSPSALGTQTSSNPIAGGTMFMHADHGSTVLATADSIQYTIKVQFG